MGFSIPTGGRPHRRCRRAAIAAAGAVAADHGDYGDTTGAAEIHGESGERWEIFFANMVQIGGLCGFHQQTLFSLWFYLRVCY